MKTKTTNLMVYRYEFWDEKTQSTRASGTYATLDAILRGMGIPLLHTAKAVARSRIYHDLLEAGLGRAGPPVEAAGFAEEAREAQ